MTRRMMFAFVAVMLVSSVAFGAEEEKEKKRPGGPGGGDLFALVEKLDLSAEQKEKIAEIKTKSQEAMKAAREAKDREAGRKAYTEAREAVMAVLTDAQKEQLKKLAGDRKPGDRPDGDKKRPERKPE